MTICPNCQQEVETTAILCPHCGARLNPALGNRRWLTPPSSWLEMVLGLLLGGFASLFFAGFGTLLPLIFYFVFRDSHADFARGLLIAAILASLLYLGAIALCMVRANPAI